MACINLLDEKLMRRIFGWEKLEVLRGRGKLHKVLLTKYDYDNKVIEDEFRDM
jgi:hypothetical protein